MAEVAVVTGGAGFIGSHLVEALSQRGTHVRVFDNLIKDKIEGIQPLLDEGRVEFVGGDLRSRDMVDKVMQGVDYVFHTAGVHGMASPEETIQVNLHGSYNVFRAALDHGVKRVIFSSSSSIYGSPEKLPMSEEDPPSPMELYGASKWMCEQLLRHLGKEGLNYNALRYFNVYGERQAAHPLNATVIISITKRLLSGQSPVINGAGTQAMDFTHVSDVVRANLLAMESPTANEVFNVGTGVSTTIRDLAFILIDALGVKIQPTFNGKPTLVSRRQADTRKAKELLGFVAEVPVRDGLTQVAQAIAKSPGWH